MLNLNVLEDVLELAQKEAVERHHRRAFSPECQLYCPSCGGERKMRVERYLTAVGDEIKALFEPATLQMANTIEQVKEKDILLFRYTCLQCNTIYTALVYPGAQGKSLIVLPSINGGLSTPNTPQAVAYYLDQASRAQSAGATSAAMVMFRAALEHLLLDQGYTGMLGSQIAQLEKDINNGTAKRWFMDLDRDYLTIMKNLGNGAAHTNKGDISLQAQFDSGLIEDVKVTFHELLTTIYELPQAQSQRKKRLNSISFPKP